MIPMKQSVVSQNIILEQVPSYFKYYVKLSAADIHVGYERTVYTTSEGDMSVELCAIIYEPITGVAPRDFVVSSTTSAGTAGMMHHLLK